MSSVVDKLYAAGKSPITGRQKLFEIRSQDNDLSFSRQLSDAGISDKLELFAYGYACEHGPQGTKKCQKCGELTVMSRKGRGCPP